MIIRIKIQHIKLTALYKVHTHLIAAYTTDSPHSYLLLHHLKELTQIFQTKLSDRRKTYTLSLTELQAIAFCQIWDEVYSDEASEYTYERVIIEKIQDEIFADCIAIATVLHTFSNTLK